jgi:replicative DNA helicase
MSIAALVPPAAEAPGYRQVPHDLETEQALLGAILVNNEALERVSGYLKAEHFFVELHQRIFEACATVIRKGYVASPASLRPHFALDVAMKELGGPDYLAELAKFSPAVINAGDYGRMIYEMAQRRDLIRVGEDLVAHAFDPPLDHGTADIIEKAEGALYQVAETSRYGGGFKSFKESLTGAVTAAERAFQSSSHVSGVGTGFDDLDHMLGGFQASDLIIVAGRPGMGKTAFATNIAFHAARNHFLSGQKSGAAVAFFSLEMSAEQLAGRILAAEAEIQGNKIRRGKIESRDFEKLAQVAMDLESIPLSIDDTGGLTIAQVAARCRKLKRTRGLGMVMVDYLQLLSGSLNKRNENRVQEVTEITKGLKNLAKELSVPVVALSQLSRSVDSRDDKRPVLADLRESGSIEQDADVVLFVFREEYYLATKEPDPDDPGYAKWQEKMSRIHGKAEVLVEKHRHGPTGPVHLGFEKQFTRFFNLAKEEFLPDRRR